MQTQPETYPDTPVARTRWILDRRPAAARFPRKSSEPAGWEVDREPDEAGRLAEVLTIFLTNRECPWRCLMCDLWRQTIEDTVPEGAIPAQIDLAMAHFRALAGASSWLKLYNAGSFFDLAAIPHADYAAIVERCRSFERVIVECHPALVGERVLAFRDLLPASAGLEVALGLETAHPDVLEKLNKRMTLAGFRRAVRYLKEHGCRVRSFVLVRPPFLDEKASLEWARKSLDFAFDAGVDTVSLIPTRFGNGALEELNRQGLFDPPQIETLATAFEYGLSLNRGRVFADLWDLERIVSGSALSEWRARLGRWNLSQRAES